MILYNKSDISCFSLGEPTNLTSGFKTSFRKMFKHQICIFCLANLNCADLAAMSEACISSSCVFIIFVDARSKGAIWLILHSKVLKPTWLRPCQNLLTYWGIQVGHCIMAIWAFLLSRFFIRKVLSLLGWVHSIKDLLWIEQPHRFHFL